MFYPTFLISILIGYGFYDILNLQESLNNKRNIWELVVFSFIVGSLILTMSDKVLHKHQKEYFPRLGSSIIVSGLILLIGSGTSRILYDTPLLYIGLSISMFGLFFLSFCLASLFIEFGKTLFRQ